MRPRVKNKASNVVYLNHAMRLLSKQFPGPDLRPHPIEYEAPIRENKTMSNPVKSLHDKARFINFNSPAYGSFAEIGAGQETARNFFIAGGASKTVAKTMSAYDMVFSDAIYGPEKTGRYVCESRLLKMLEHEYKLVVERLKEKRAGENQFFAFANTVAARSSRGIEEGHGWLGIRYQPSLHSAPHDIVLHVKMLDRRNLLQQEALGIVGVNLIYGAYMLKDDPEKLIESLFDGFDDRRIEIDMIRFTGPEFKKFDNHILNLYLVQKDMTDAVMFDANGDIVQPHDLLYKKEVALLRGRFRPFTKVHLDILESGMKTFTKEGIDKNSVMPICELTMNNLMVAEKLDVSDFLHRVETLTANKIPVMVSNFSEYYKARMFFEKLTKCKVRMVMGTAHLKDILNEAQYKDLQGGLYEALGDLFRGDCKIYCYPMKDGETVLTTKTYQPPKHLQHIYNHFVEAGKIDDIDEFNKEYLNIVTEKIVERIKSHSKDWEDQVPAETVKIIKEKKLFGY